MVMLGRIGMSGALLLGALDLVYLDFVVAPLVLGDGGADPTRTDPAQRAELAVGASSTEPDTDPVQRAAVGARDRASGANPAQRAKLADGTSGTHPDTDPDTDTDP